jgi:hypothetical protein
MNLPTASAPIPASRRRRRSLRFAVAGIAVLAATPAAASVVMQNFVRADVDKADACMVKVAGKDAGTFNNPGKLPYVAFSDADSIVVNDTKLINETLSITALKGDRLLVSDGMRIVNKCAYSITVQLAAEADPAGGAAIENWKEMHMELFLASKPGGAGTLPFSAATNWDMSPVVANADGSLGNTVTGSVTLGAGEEVQVGAMIDTDRNADAAVGTGTLRFTVSGTAG